MQVLRDTDALRLYEEGRHLRPVAQAQALLATVHPEAAPETLASLPVGDRNARLLRARAAAMGDALPCQAQCPACGEPLEFELSTRTLLEATMPAAEVHVAHEGQVYTARVPTDADLLAVLAEGGGRRSLMARCALAPSFEAWPEAAVAAVEAQLAEADPLALLTFDLSCPACAHAWAEPLDVVGFFFRELTRMAHHALYDVHRLARAYGWREADVLALSPWRRQQYLALAEA